MVFLCYSVLYCVIVLFEQKTAYEMRISDWSSDVCSSDLIVMARRQTQAATTQVLRQLHVGFAIADHHAGGEVDVAIAQVMQQHADTAIGNASCRERVCQYV